LGLPKQSRRSKLISIEEAAGVVKDGRLDILEPDDGLDAPVQGFGGGCRTFPCPTAFSAWTHGS
jgi:hypothetical protein